MRSGIAVVVALVTTAGCTSPPSPATESVTRDSAGVRVVTHGALPAAIEIWELEERPDGVVGTLDGPGPDVFGRIADVVELSDGTLVVADALARELRAFRSDGSHAWTAGGRGDGPGEIATLAIVGVFEGDSVGVFDSRNRRVSIFSREGMFVRAYPVTLPLELREPLLTGITQGGSLVGLAHDQPMIPREVGPYQMKVDAIFFDPSGALRARG